MGSWRVILSEMCPEVANTLSLIPMGVVFMKGAGLGQEVTSPL